MRKTGSLLELLSQIRSHKALDRAVKKNRYYRTTLKEQDKAFDELDKAGLSKEQKRIVDRVICTINANGAAYGRIAYRLGLRDGIQLAAEVNKV